MKLRRPAPRPCESCPYRTDAPSGLWADSEYVKLAEYDRETFAQPTGAFQCHQTEAGNPRSRVCAGWAGTHRHNPRGHELLALRLAGVFGTLDAEDLDATIEYQTDVPLFASGAAAAAHGMAELDHPGLRARVIADKILRTRPDARTTEEEPDDESDRG